MRFLPKLFENNRAWAAARRREDGHFFERLVAVQRPDYLWIGCADSRVPANEIVGLRPGELFVHRNVANVVPPGDRNALSVLQYAVDVLGVEHVIVCGHYGCGGVRAALEDPLPLPLEEWIGHVRRVRVAHAEELDAAPDAEARWRLLCERNVMAQAKAVCETATIQEAWRRGHRLVVHGWIYDLHDGLLRDLEVSCDKPS